MGGNTTRAIRRAVESCQGWCPFRSGRISSSTRTAAIDSVDDLVARIEVARRHAAEIGRTEPLDICFSGSDHEGGGPQGAAAKRAELERLAEAGVTWVSVGFDGPGVSRATVLDRARRFADEVLAPAR
jgi:hypothetical protein